MVAKFALLIVLLPLAYGWPMGEPDKAMMQMMMMMKGEKEKDMDPNMMNYMMSMWKKEMKKEHYPGDPDGCKKEEDNEYKEWMEKKKKEEEEKKMKMMEEYKKFKEYMSNKKMMEMKYAEEMKEKMQEMWQKQQEMKKREMKEKEFEEMVESFQSKKHKFAFKLTHEFLQLCQCAEVSEQMQKLSMFEMQNGTDMMSNMTSEGAAHAMDSGDMEMLAKKMSKMSPEEKKKVFMAGMIKSMCNGAQGFIKHAKEFERMYMVKYTDDKPADD